MKKLCLAFFAAMFSSFCCATPQEPDVLLCDGTEYNLLCCPLESFFENYELLRPQSNVVSTALYRGYIATFELTDGMLMLTSVKVPVGGDEMREVVGEVFPNQSNVFADWYSGDMLAVRSDAVFKQYGYGNFVYDTYSLKKIEKGRLVGKSEMSHEEYKAYRNALFESHKQTDEYKKNMEELLKRAQTSPWMKGADKDRIEAVYRMVYEGSLIDAY